MAEESVPVGGLVIRLDANEWVFEGGALVTIGRSTTCDVTIDNDHVSRHHIELVSIDGLWRGRDLDTLNGTVVNGEAVMNFELAGPTTLAIGGNGGTTLTLEPDLAAPGRDDATADLGPAVVEELPDLPAAPPPADPDPTVPDVDVDDPLADVPAPADLADAPAPPEGWGSTAEPAEDLADLPAPPPAAIADLADLPAPPVMAAEPEPEPEPAPEPEPEPVAEADDLPAAGWYPDAGDPTQERYWNGTGWDEAWQPVGMAASEASASGLPAAAWYADPDDPSRQRYWDGRAWTDHYHPPLT